MSEKIKIILAIAALLLIVFLAPPQNEVEADYFKRMHDHRQKP